MSPKQQPQSEPRYFARPSDFRAWLGKHHANERALLVGFHKRHTDKPSLTWPEAVAEALCLGWIDGVRRRIDDERYSIRFTPRKARSKWSAVNIKMFAALESDGRMTDAGRAAFARRTQGNYSYEQRDARTPEFDRASVSAFRRNARAWTFFETLPPSYRKKVVHWVMSAKQTATRSRRLKRLITLCAKGERLA